MGFDANSVLRKVKRIAYRSRIRQSVFNPHLTLFLKGILANCLRFAIINKYHLII